MLEPGPPVTLLRYCKRVERFEECCKYIFCSGCVEGFLASEVTLGQGLCGDVWEFSVLRRQERSELFVGV